MIQDEVAGYPRWWDMEDSPTGPVEVRFVGAGPDRRPDRQRLLETLEGKAPRVAWAEQVHGDTVLEVDQPGPAGEGDALITREPNLALAVSTADCVPVLLTAPDGTLAAVHAGWRGILANVVGATLDRFSGPLEEVTAWIGPAIAGCCYQVENELAERMAEVVGSREIIQWKGVLGIEWSSPRLDLPQAVGRQLVARGVDDLRILDVCTHCSGINVHGHRRDRELAGRNLSFIWREE